MHNWYWNLKFLFTVIINLDCKLESFNGCLWRMTIFFITHFNLLFFFLLRRRGDNFVKYLEYVGSFWCPHHFKKIGCGCVGARPENLDMSRIIVFYFSWIRNPESWILFLLFLVYKLSFLSLNFSFQLFLNIRRCSLFKKKRKKKFPLSNIILKGFICSTQTTRRN